MLIELNSVPLNNRTRCKAQNQEGKKCGNLSSEGSEYCWIHQHLNKPLTIAGAIDALIADSTKPKLLRWTVLGALVFFSFSILFMIWTLFGPIGDFFSELLRNNFESQLLATFGGVTVIFALIGICGFVFLKLMGSFERRITVSFYLTVVIMLWVLVSGCVFIQTEFGKPQISLYLKESYDVTEYAGFNMTCADSNGELIANREIICDIVPKMENFSGFVKLDYENGTYSTTNITNLKPSFNSSLGVNRISFSIVEYSGNTSHERVTGHYVRFYTIEEWKERRNRFLSFSIALIGFVMLSVPAMMYNFRKLLEKK